MMWKQNLQRVLVIWLAIASTRGFAANQQQSIEKIYTEENTSISLTRNTPQFTIKLKSNPTTGYSWFLREYDKSIIMAVKHSFQAPNISVIGASGYEFWTFRIKERAFTVPIQTELKFIYARPWTNRDKTKEVTFKVST